MSTKSTIAEISDYTWLEEDMLDETTWLVIRGPHADIQTNALGTHLHLHLTPSVLDKIAEIHTRGQFPHQRQNPTFLAPDAGA